ncbi:MAG TPA: PAS domain S-box protein [Methanoregula sp.]|nr:PAS domain S-box protein [Methanoregula sp.]
MPLLRNSISVLYIDDDPSLLEIGKAFLELSGRFAVATTEHPLSVMELLEKQEYDCIISDYQMPVLDGIGLLRQIRRQYPGLPFILFTGKGREEVVIQAFDAGADYYVQKGRDVQSQFRELSHKIQLAVEKRYADRALRESEERYRNVVQDQNEFICRFRPDGTYIFANNAFCRTFGVKEDVVINRRFTPLMPAEDARAIRNHLASLTPENPQGTIEHRILFPDGAVRWHQWIDRAIFSESGALEEYQSAGRDITEQKIAEMNLKKTNDDLLSAFEQLTATEEELRTSYQDLAQSQHQLEARELILDAIIQASPIPQFVIDKNHRVLHWNQALAAYSGIAAHGIIGTDQHWRAFYMEKRPCLADLLMENAEDRMLEWYHDRLERSRLIDGAYSATDFFPHMGFSGKWLHFTAGLIRDHNGAIIGAVETLQDVTDEKQKETELAGKHQELAASFEQLAATEEELRNNYEQLTLLEGDLRKSHALYRGVVEDQTELICRFRPDGTIVFANNAYCRYFNTSQKEITGRVFRPEVFVDEREQVKDTFRSLTPDNPVASINQRTVLPDGTIRWQNWVDRAIFDGNGTLVEYQSVGRDITDVRTAELKLERKNEMLHAAYGQLAAAEEELRANFSELEESRQRIRESEERYRAVVEGQTELICRFRPDGTFVFVNEAFCRYLKKAREEIIGHVILPEIPQEEQKRLARHFRRLTPEHPVGQIDHRIILPDGAVTWQSWVDHAIYDGNGRLVEYQSVGRDISDYKKAVGEHSKSGRKNREPEVEPKAFNGNGLPPDSRPGK